MKSATTSTEVNFNPQYAQYAYSKISDAVSTLATHPGDVRNRLYAATFSLFEATPEMLPPNIRPELEWVKEQLTRFPPRYNEGALQSTLKRIRNSTAVKIAKRIVLIQAMLEAYLIGK